MVSFGDLARTSKFIRQGYAAHVSHQPVRPQHLTRHDYLRLGEADRAGYDAGRLRHHAKLPILRTTDVREIIRRILRLLTLNSMRDSASRSHLAITGPPGCGKTAATWVAAAGVHCNAIRDLGPEIEKDEIGSPRVPVAFVTAPAVRTAKQLFAQLNHFYDPHYSGNTSDLMARVLDRIYECETSLVVIDDAHALRRGSGGNEALADELKGFINMLPATLVLVGVSLESTVFSAVSSHDDDLAKQLEVRLERHHVQKLSLQPTSNGGDSTFTRFVRALEGELVLLDHKPGTLGRPSVVKMLYDVSQGVPAVLVKWIEAASVAAIGTTECLTPELLRDTPRPGRL